MKTKTMYKLILIIAVIGEALASKKSRKHKKHMSTHKASHKSKYTPKALDLNNHYGGSNVDSQYGPVTTYEEHVEKNPEVYAPHKYTAWKDVKKELEFKPYPGWENKFNPHQVKSGDFTNIAPSASKVIKPEITPPKMRIQAEVNYPSHVKVPTFYGFKKEYHPVSAYDKEEGKIIHDNVLLNVPQYGWEDKVR